MIVDSNKSFKAIFKEGICIRYNEASITVVNGTISDNGDYFLIKPNNSKSFGYWYKNEDIGTIANDFKSENIKIYKNDLKGNVKYTALDSLTGYAMFSLESDDYDVATRFSELLTSSSFEDFIVNTTIPY